MPAEQWNNTKSNYAFPPQPVTGATKKRVVLFVATSTYSVKSDDDSVRNDFLQLASQWKKETGHTSKLFYKFMNKNYQRIMAMGNSVVPVILNEIKNKPDHWYWALEMISNENPVDQEHVGRVDLMCKDWVNWGLKKGYIVS